MEKTFRRIIRIPSHRQLVRAQIEGRRVLARFDFNVPIENGNIKDTKRIESALPTIRKILARGAVQLNIICHLGRPNGESNALSTAPVAATLSRFLGFKPAARGVKLNNRFRCLSRFYPVGDKIRVFENLRFDGGEEKNSAVFSKALSELGDIFVQDAFANIHRAHASMVGVASILPPHAGLLVEREVNSLFRLLHHPRPPFVAVIGGAKAEDKMPIIRALSERAEAVVVGGRTANEWILRQHAIAANIYLPTDGINKVGAIVRINEKTLNEGVFDIGPRTIMLFKTVIASAKTVFWNGNLGMTEKSRFSHGTFEIARFIAKLRIEKIASGGNTAEVINHLRLRDSFNFISTGGGATSDFIIGKKMPALEILLK